MTNIVIIGTSRAGRTREHAEAEVLIITYLLISTLNSKLSLVIYYLLTISTLIS